MPALTQFLRFALVGLAANALAFVLYLGLTTLGVGPKTAMSLLYLAVVVQTFVFNKRWSFRYQGGDRSVMLRYAGVYALGYLFNLAMLVILVDHAQWPHGPVQAGLILAVAALSFVLHKFWVFVQPQAHSGRQAP